MNDFLWSSGHLGWGIFALVVFSGIWWLCTDLVWRLRNTRIVKLVAVMSVGWIIGEGLIVLGFWLANR